MALQELYGEYKPQGLVGGMVSGLNTGANLGSMFANTASTNQQTMSREQKLPYELADMAGKNDELTMKNDLTRATQTSEILSQKGANTLGTEQLTGMTIEKAKQLYPFQKARELHRESSKSQISMLNRMLDGIKTGNIDGVRDELLSTAQKPEEKQMIMAEYAKVKHNPREAIAHLENVTKTMTDRLNRTSEQEELKMWLAELSALTDQYQARMSASASSSKANDKMSIDQRISDAEAKKAALFASGAKPNDPRIINLGNLVNSLNAARSKAEGMVIPQGGLPSSYTNYGTGASFNDLSGGIDSTPAAKPNIIKLK